MTKTVVGMVAFAVWSLAAGGDTDVAGKQAVIGQAVSQGTLKVNKSSVRDSATLYAGNELEAGNSPVRFMLKNGVRGSLSPASTASMFADRLEVKLGDAAIAPAAGFRVEAGGLTLAAGKSGRVQVQVQKEKVLVASLSGATEVFDASGLLLARVTPLQPLEFEPIKEPPQAITVTGVLENKDGRFQLKDEVTGLVYELQGEALKASDGKRIHVTGKLQAAAQGQPQVIAAERTSAAGTAKSGSGIKRGTKISMGVSIAAVGAAAATFAAISR
ncbi:MAG: hypothetical protein HZB13_17315 [Acidobacteria bacterium]|nr:hypothetical protein [Acidobacteriota bacterium]